MKDCEKLAEHTGEWNAIYPFMEWLQEKGYFLARHQTKEEAGGDEWGTFPYPIAVGKSIEQLLYEYFGVNPEKLERERREILKDLREKAKPPNPNSEE